MRKKITSTDVAKKYIQVYRSAHDRGIDFNLNLTVIRNLLKARKCYFTGMYINSDNFSIDRVDNSKGYVIGNVVTCDVGFNQRKADLTKEQIVQMYEGLQRKGLIT